MPWNQSAPRRKHGLQGFRKFFRQYLRLFRQIPGANPVAHAGGSAGLGNEAPDFRSKISLRGVQVSSSRCRQISLRDADALDSLLLRGRSFFGRQLGHDNRCFWFIGGIVVGRRIRRTSRSRRVAVRRRDRRRRRRNQDVEFWHGIRRRVIDGWRRRWQFRPHLNRRVHRNDGFLRIAPHPAARNAAEHITAKETRAPERNGIAREL